MQCLAPFSSSPVPTEMQDLASILAIWRVAARQFGSRMTASFSGTHREAFVDTGEDSVRAVSIPLSRS